MNPAVARRLGQDRNQVPESVVQSKRHQSSPSMAVLPVLPSEPSGSSQRLDRQGLLLLHLPQVRLVAKSIWDRMRFAVELDDLVGYGMIGLMNAVERFDPDRGILLKTYAEYRIRGAILDGLRGMDWLPRTARQKERQQRKELLTPEPKGNPHRSNLKLGVCRTAVKTAPRSLAGTPRCQYQRMESIFPGGNLGDLEKLAESPRARGALRNNEPNPESLYERKERYDLLAEALSNLPRRQRQIIDLYYQGELSMKQIGEILRVHESRVSQLHAAAIRRLRVHLAAISEVSTNPGRKPPQRYSPRLRDRVCSRRRTAAQSSSVSTPMVSWPVSAT
ncbi:MAG: sigma-70 family RNA polymerase sigma factor [Acidobacteria bacterium]|nr:sigma-70 family RNA polymerase sigma factor [Acidobacteriota bacterium]